MKPIRQFLSVASDSELEKLLADALDLLEDPGMRVGGTGLRKALGVEGAAVDEPARIVRFPRPMIEEVLATAVSEEKCRFEKCGGDTLEAEDALSFSWHVGHMTRSPDFEVALGGGCPLYYDYPSNSVRYGSEADLIRLLHLAEGIPEIRRCGNPIHCVIDKDDCMAQELMALQTAATVAKHSSKPGVTALLSARQLPYSVAMGEVKSVGAEESFSSRS